MGEYELDPGVKGHYAEGAERDRLLGGGAGRLEYLRTRELFARHLPSAPATVVDVGGGAGIYALPLAAEGYSVHLIDPVPLHVEQAIKGSSSQPKAPLASVEVGDARGLPMEQASADAVLLLGPLYHLTERTDRVLALREARAAWSGPEGLSSPLRSRASPPRWPGSSTAFSRTMSSRP